MRMTLSLTAILIEATGNISFALPLIVTFTFAKWTGDLFTDGIYDTQIAVSEVIIVSVGIKPVENNIRLNELFIITNSGTDARLAS